MNRNQIPAYSIYVIEKRTGKILASVVGANGVIEAHAIDNIDVIIDGNKEWTEGDRICQAKKS